jgi:hypothetical protein
MKERMEVQTLQTNFEKKKKKTVFAYLSESLSILYQAITKLF